MLGLGSMHVGTTNGFWSHPLPALYFPSTKRTHTPPFVCCAFPSGMGCAHSYISTCSAVQKWYPERKGVAAGTAVFGMVSFTRTRTHKPRTRATPEKLGSSTPDVELATFERFCVF